MAKTTVHLENLIDSQTLMDTLGISRNTMNRLIVSDWEQGIHYFRVGKNARFLRFDKSKIEEWLTKLNQGVKVG
jgi:predicted DNA-binding transcriptional regulator AlpA